ncbi:unnamed protein product [Cunninghamella blakesleeana]
MYSLIFFIITFTNSNKKFNNKTTTTSSSSSTGETPIYVKSLYSRLSDEKLLLLYSALGHMKIGYVTNCTPDIDTPPLTIMYSCKSDLMGCGSFGTRMMNIIQSYYFAMFLDGTAYTIDMDYPLDFHHYFEAKPGNMALLPQQIYKYIDELDKKGNHLLNNTMQTMSFINNDDNNDIITTTKNKKYRDYYLDQKIAIIQVNQWDTMNTWHGLQTIEDFKPLRDKYRLNHLTEKSEWVWLIHRLLFHPTEWLMNQLQPYRLLMGGQIGFGDSLSLKDPQQQLDPNVITSWFRIGLYLDLPTSSSSYNNNNNINNNGKNHPYLNEEEEIKNGKQMISCWMGYIQRLCEIEKTKRNKSCHVFIASKSSFYLDQFRYQFQQRKYTLQPLMTIHHLDDSYPFMDLDQPLTDIASSKKSLFETDEHTLKFTYARSIMDWLILSKMDYLLGPEQNDFIKLAAWSAQVQTDLLSNIHSCKTNLFRDW